MQRWRDIKPRKAVRQAVNWLFCQTIGRKFTGGTSIKSVIKKAKELNDKGHRVVINQLGEHYHTEDQVNETIDIYSALLIAMSEAGIYGNITLKPSQFGFYVDSKEEGEEREKYTFFNMLKIAARAAELGIAVEIDMEDRDTFKFTVTAYRYLRQLLKGRLILALQANVGRSGHALEYLIGLSTREKPCGVRLVKGIYKNIEVGLQDAGSILDHFKDLVHTALTQSGPEFVFALGSHHTDVIGYSATLLSENPREHAELQVLFGIQNHLIEPGTTGFRDTGVYIGFGPNSFPYCFRRTIESPGPMYKILSSVFKQNYEIETANDTVQGNTGEASH